MPGDVIILPEPGQRLPGGEVPAQDGNDDMPRRKRKRYLEEGTAAPPNSGDQPGYYDIPMLKAPVWTWEISTYFFLGGVSTGAYILARLAERFGGDVYADLTKRGTYIAAIAAAPCAPLLIADLGDPKRFHHMLRVFKPASPMNLGTWALSSYTITVVLATLREWLGKNASDALPIRLLRRSDGIIAVIADVAGIPLALLVAGYTGVLLSGTATPVWSKNLFLGPLFSASAISTGTAAVQLALEAAPPKSDDPNQESPASVALAHIGTVAHAAEAATLSGYLGTAGARARPLTVESLSPQFWAGVVGVGLILPEILERVPAPPRAKRWLRIGAAVATLVGGLILRSAVTRAGSLSANSPQANRDATRAKTTPPPQNDK